MKTLLKSLAYQALDLATAGRGIRRLIGGEQIRFPPRWCRYYAADYEPATFAFLRTHAKPGQTVLDIGAHLGLFTVVLARLVGPAGRVFSFEPTALTRQVLERTVRINGCSSVVEIRAEAVSRATGMAEFHDTGDPGSNANSLIRTQRSRSSANVPTISLDDFVKSRGIQPGCLKIDVEGAELDLLRGAGDVFMRCRPAVYLSLHPAAIHKGGGSLAEVWELLHRYRMSVRSDGKPLDETVFCQSERLFDVGLLPA